MVSCKFELHLFIKVLILNPQKDCTKLSNLLWEWKVCVKIPGQSLHLVAVFSAVFFVCLFF